MSLQDWLRNGWLTRHQTSREEITDLLAVADRDLADCRAAGLSADWRLAIAYNAALQAATAGLAVAGFRAARESHHYYVIQSLAYTVQANPDLIAEFDGFRKKRNLAAYERSGATSDQEAEEMIELAETLRRRIAKWIRSERPGLL